MTRQIVVGGIKLHQDEPLKIAVPIVGETMAELYKEAKAAVRHHIDLVEWRLDYFKELTDRKVVKEVLEELKTILRDIPMIVTLRTINEGGSFPEDWTAYSNIISTIILESDIAAVDLQLNCPEPERSNLIALAKKNQVATILSHHNFYEVPILSEMIVKAEMMTHLNPSIIKLAYMVNEKSDLIRMSVLKEHWETVAPLVLIGMGPLGKATRIDPRGVLTYSSISKESAPGQISLPEIRRILKS